jgi:rhamnulokinase
VAHTLACAAVDLGAESGRTFVGSFDGNRVRLEEVHRFANTPRLHGAVLCWDEKLLRRGVEDGLRAARAHAGRLDSISVDAWGVDVALRANGALVAPLRHYRSFSCVDMKTTLETVSAWELYERTGIQLLPINTVFQLDARRDELAAADEILPVPDLVNAWLTGESATEETIASTTQLVDVGTGDWSDELLDRLELPRAPLPEIRPCGSVLGTSDGADVVLGPSHDTAAAVAAVPADGDDVAYVSSGTWSLVGVERTEPVVTEASFTANLTNERGICGRTRVLRNVMGLWLLQECRRAWGNPQYEELVRLAADAGPVPLFDPDADELLRTGIDMPHRIVAATRNRLASEPGAITRSIFESLAVAYRRALDDIEAATGVRSSTVHVVGGGSRNRLLCQLTADATERPVLAGPVEASALGNVLGQLLARAVLTSRDDLRSVSRRSVTPDRYEPAGALTGAVR